MRRAIGALAIFSIGIVPPAFASGYGSLNNFDAVNDNGVPCHGFEIEIEDIHSRDITYTYDWNHYGAPKITEDSLDPLHPKVHVRYESKKNPDGSWASYTAVPAGPIAPTDGHQFTNPGVNFGGEHFGVGFYGAPTLVKYHWLIDDGAGNLVHGTAVNIGTPTFTYFPPAVGQPAQVQAVLRAPPEEEEIHEKEFGEATWVKVITTVTHNNNRVELWDLVSDDPDDPDDDNWTNGEPDEVEVEFELLQTEFSKLDGGANGEQIGAPEELENGDEVITRRYEFFKYIGPYDDESGEALTDSVGPDGIHGDEVKVINGVEVDFSTVEIVGDYIGAQMAGFDAEDPLGLILNLQDGEINVPYVERRIVIGGAPPVAFEVIGDLPEGMDFDIVDAVLFGTPLESGIFPITVNSSDGLGAVASRDYELVIAAAPVPQWSVTTSASPAAGGTTGGDGSYEDGTSVIVTATANEGYEFINWTEGAVEVSASASYQFTANSDRALVANFALVPVAVYRNVAGLVTVVESAKSTSLDRRTRKLTSVAKVTITNNSGETIEAPMRLFIKNLPAGVTMPMASGMTADGYYYDLEGKLGISTLAPGANAVLTLKFVYPMTTRISYALEFWGMASAE